MLKNPLSPGKKPRGLHWRSSVWYITFVIGLGITVDLLVYSIIIPVLPFQLERLKYTGVSGLVGWLLFSYSCGLVLSTAPIAVISEKYANRTYILISGQVFLIASQILLMEAPAYWVMVIARALQGVSSSMVWVPGLALICDSCAEAVVGRQLGIAMLGVSLGTLAGPPLGGALYTKFGFHGPFILTIAITVIDLILRFLIIERKHALRYGFDPAAFSIQDVEATTEARSESETAAEDTLSPSNGKDEPIDVSLLAPPKRLSQMGVLKILLKSVRALTVLYNTLIYGVAFTSQEPALPLYLQAKYGLDSSKVGLIYIAGVVPTLLSAPLAGWWTDRSGTEWITVFGIIASLPWWGLIALRSSLAVFIVFYALLFFFTSAVIAPLTAELAAVSKSHEGVGYAHVYGAFNFSFGIGSTIGPIIGGQIYQHIKDGWLVLSLIDLVLLAISASLAFCYTGDRPLLTGLRTWRKRSGSQKPIVNEAAHEDKRVISDTIS